MFRIGANLGLLYYWTFLVRTFLVGTFLDNRTFLLAPKQVLYHPGPELPSTGLSLVKDYVGHEPSLGPIGFLLILPYFHAAAGFNGPCNVPLKPLVLYLTFKLSLSFVCFDT